MTDKAQSETKDGYAVLLQRLVRFVFNGIFNWGTMWCSLALFVNHNGYPYIGLGCLFLWVLFMILDELKQINRKLTTEEVKAKYYELIIAVSHKFTGETRHETALRYIQKAEISYSGVGSEERT